MSRSRLKVAIGAALSPVGYLDFEARPDKQVSAFWYSDEWLGRGDAFPLAPGMPLDRARMFASARAADPRPALLGVFADCAPDGWGRRLIRDARGHTPTEIEYLTGVDDHTRQGALRFLDANDIPLAHSVPPVPRLARLPDIRKLAHAYETSRGDVRAVAHELRGPGSSLGGARPKSAFEGEDGHLYLAKYTSEKDDFPVERMEVAALRLATEVGLRASTASLALGETPHPVALIRRFDRARGARLHYASARTFLGDLGNEGGFYSDLADVMRSHCGDERSILGELRELHRRILFTILVSNEDDHLKNHGFLYAGQGAWRLSPAFDINPTPDRRFNLKTGISELSGFEASAVAAIEAAPFFEVAEDDARADALRMANTITERWRPLCLEMGMSNTDCDRFAPAFDLRERLDPLHPPASGSPAPSSRTADSLESSGLSGPS